MDEFEPITFDSFTPHRPSAPLSIEDREEIDRPEVALLRGQLKPLTEHLLHADVEEIAVNMPGEVWQKMRSPPRPGEHWRRIEAPRLTRAYLERICYMIANTQNIPNFGPRGTPVVYGTIPGGHRFGAGVGGNFRHTPPTEYDVDGTVCLCIRQTSPDRKVTLGDYKINRQEDATESLLSIFSKTNDPPNAIAKVMNSLTRGDHILVSGMTGSGKTTLINHLISHLSEHSRVLTVEDTRELYVPQANRIHIVMSRTDQANKFTYPMVRDLIVRMTPDVILAGEVSNANAATIWDLMTTGHGHFMTTVHAESVEEAITTFMNCIEYARAANGATAAIDKVELAGLMREKLRIVQCSKNRDGERYISRIL